MQYIDLRPDVRGESCNAAWKFGLTANFVERTPTWHHIAVTWTKEHGLTKIYKDGLLMAEVSHISTWQIHSQWKFMYYTRLRTLQEIFWWWLLTHRPLVLHCVYRFNVSGCWHQTYQICESMWRLLMSEITQEYWSWASRITFHLDPKLSAIWRAPCDLQAKTEKSEPLESDGAFMLGNEQDCYGGCTDSAQAFYGLMDEVIPFSPSFTLPLLTLAVKVRQPVWIGVKCILIYLRRWNVSAQLSFFTFCSLSTSLDIWDTKATVNHDSLQYLRQSTPSFDL